MTRAVDDTSHDTAQSVYLSHEMTFSDTSDGRVQDIWPIMSRLMVTKAVWHAHARGGSKRPHNRRGLADYNHVEIFVKDSLSFSYAEARKYLRENRLGGCFACNFTQKA